MRNLMKMELYRFASLSKSLALCVVGAFCIAALPLSDASGYYDSFLEVSGSAYMGLTVSGGIGITALAYPLFLMFVIGYYMNKQLKNKTFYYEKLHEQSAAKLILSKSLLLGVLASTIAMFPIIIVFGILTIKNGYTDVICGELFAGHMPMRFIILYVCSLHLTIVMVPAAIVFRSGARAFIYGVIRYFVWDFIWVILYDAWEGTTKIVAMFLEPIEVIRLMGEGIDAKHYSLLFFVSLGSLFVNYMIFYLLAYFCMRKMDWK